MNVSSMAGRLSLPSPGGTAVEPGSFGTDIWSHGADVLPDQTQEVYEKSYSRSGLVIGNQRLMPDPVWVTRTVRVALSVPAPKLLPTRLGDAVGQTVPM